MILQRWHGVGQCMKQVRDIMIMTVQVQNASTEDVNRSWLGRALGAILLLWLASVSLGLPFKYGLAAALLAISAVLFLDWDRARRGGARATRSPASAALAPVSPPCIPGCHVSSDRAP